MRSWSISDKIYYLIVVDLAMRRRQRMDDEVRYAAHIWHYNIVLLYSAGWWRFQCVGGKARHIIRDHMIGYTPQYVIICYVYITILIIIRSNGPSTSCIFWKYSCTTKAWFKITFFFAYPKMNVYVILYPSV